MKGQIEISRRNYNDKDFVGISIKDELSRITFLNLEISYENFGKLMSGLSCVDCDFKIKEINKIGKKKITNELIFEMPEGYEYENRKTIACDIVNHGIKIGHEGWEIKDSLNSKNSFYSKDDIEYCKMNIAKWIDVDQ